MWACRRPHPNPGSARAAREALETARRTIRLKRDPKKTALPEEMCAPSWTTQYSRPLAVHGSENVSCLCALPTGWHFDPARTNRYGKFEVECGLFPTEKNDQAK